MSHFKDFIQSMQKSGTVKALAIVATVAIPTLGHANDLKNADSSPAASTAISITSELTPTSKVQLMQMEADQYVKMTRNFMDGLQYKSEYTYILSDTSTNDTDKVALLRSQLHNDITSFQASVVDQFPEMKQGDNPRTRMALTTDGLSSQLAHVAATVEKAEDAVRFLANRATLGGNIATDMDQFGKDIQKAQEKLQFDEETVANSNWDSVKL